MCNSCEQLNINGVNCHETGCPDAWKDQHIKCKWCGLIFLPEEKSQQFCEESCSDAYYN